MDKGDVKMIHSGCLHEIEPIKLAKEGRTLKGQLIIKQLSRLKEMLASDEGEIEFSMQCGFDEDNRVLLKGEYHARLSQICQRCLEEFISPLHGVFTLTPVFNDHEAKQLQSEYDPVLLNDECKLLLDELIEDEVMLSLSFFPKHQQEDCNLDKNQAYYTAEKVRADDQLERQHPFKDLAKMIEQADK